MCHMSCVTCHMLHVMCHTSPVMCDFFLFYFLQSCWVSRWKVCYQQAYAVYFLCNLLQKQICNWLTLNDKFILGRPFRLFVRSCYALRKVLLREEKQKHKKNKQSDTKNPAYGRHQISRPLCIVATTIFFPLAKNAKM